MKEPTKVYIVTEGKYSDRRNIGVFTTLDAANATGGDVEEWFLDNIAGAPGHYSFFQIYMDREGNVRSSRVTEYYGKPPANPHFIKSGWTIFWGIEMRGCLECSVWAKDLIHAVKIVNERRAQLIAENKWGVN